MSFMTKHFAPQLRQEGFFQEWARFIRTTSSSDVLAAFVLEGLRDTASDARRLVFTYFMTFMRTRTWAEATLELEEHFEESDRASLKAPGAEGLYDRMRTIVAAQLEAYYDQLLAQQNESRKDARGLIESDPFEKIEAKISMLVETKVLAALEPLGKQMIEELKKYMDEGEDWKGPGDQKA